MSTAIWQHIRGDLRRILLTVPSIPDVVFELAPGKPYEPVAGVAYVRERIVKGASTTSTLGVYGMTDERGIYAVDLYWPRTLAGVDGENLADAIRLTFWHGRRIMSAGSDYIRGTVLSSEARDVIPSVGWAVFPVRISFYVQRKTAQGQIA